MTANAVAAHFRDQKQQREAAMPGTWLFLATGTLMFGCLSLWYRVLRMACPEAFTPGSRHLPLWMGTVNTAFLLTSSLTMAPAVHFAAKRKRGPALLGLAATASPGLLFLGIKGAEYWLLYAKQRMPMAGLDSGGEAAGIEHLELFLGLYLSMAGLHALHVLGGVGLLSWFAWRSSTRGLGEARQRRMTAGGLYWHLVDIVWFFLFPVLYLVDLA